MKDERASEISTIVERMAHAGAKYHQIGDMAAKAAAGAGSRRQQRKWSNANRAARAVGEAVGASIWLYSVMGESYGRRGVGPDRGLDALLRTLRETDKLIDDLVFEAHVALNYQPQNIVKRRKTP